MGILRILALLVGIVFITMGVMGFMPSHVVHGDLLGYFEVNNIHYMVHIGSGVVALLAALNYAYSRLFFQVFGVIYALVAAFGFILGGNLVLMHVNTADNILHLGIAVVFLFLGFLFKTDRS